MFGEEYGAQTGALCSSAKMIQDDPSQQSPIICYLIRYHAYLSKYSTTKNIEDF